MRLSTVLVLSVLIFPLTTRAAIRISEVAWMGTAVSPNAEWVELSNEGDEEIALAGWTFVRGTSSPIVTLTKKIPAHDYLVVGRSTPAVADPVPGGSDESGPWGNGGLNNSGERIGLKNSAGIAVFDLDASSGWPAGDVSTKQTMQWDGLRWVTATATPRGPLTVSSSVTVVQNTVLVPPLVGGSSAASASTHSSPAPLSDHATEKGIFSVSAGRDRLASVGMPLVFVSMGVRSGKSVENMTTRWSFGDGAAGTGNSIEHTYWAAGTYQVVVNAEAGGVHAVDRVSVRVVSPDLTISRIAPTSRGGVEILNQSTSEINIGGATLMSGEKSFLFPQDTIIAARSTLFFSSRVSGLVVNENDRVSLAWPDLGILDSAVVRTSSTSPSALSVEKKEKIAEIEQSLQKARSELAQLTARIPQASLGAPPTLPPRVFKEENIPPPIKVHGVPLSVAEQATPLDTPATNTERVLTIGVQKTNGGIFSFFWRLFGGR